MQYKLSGNVTKPVKGLVPKLSVQAAGSVYLAVPLATCTPAGATAAALAAALPAARLVAPAGRPGVGFVPPTIASAVTNAANGMDIADWKLEGLQFALSSNAPVGAAIATGAAPGCTQLVFVNGTLRLDSTLVGARSASLAPIAQNHTMTVAAAVASGAMTLTVTNATFVFDIAPGVTPGVHSTQMTYQAAGDLVAKADLAAPATFFSVRRALGRL